MQEGKVCMHYLSGFKLSGSLCSCLRKLLTTLTAWSSQRLNLWLTVPNARCWDHDAFHLQLTDTSFCGWSDQTNLLIFFPLLACILPTGMVNNYPCEVMVSPGKAVILISINGNISTLMFFQNSVVKHVFAFFFGKHCFVFLPKGSMTCTSHSSHANRVSSIGLQSSWTC